MESEEEHEELVFGKEGDVWGDETRMGIFKNEKVGNILRKGKKKRKIRGKDLEKERKKS